MVWSSTLGDTAFTVPLFDGFMKRTMPVWTKPAKGGYKQRHCGPKSKIS